MAYVLARRILDDFLQWKQIFDENADSLKLNGCLGEPQVFVSEIELGSGPEKKKKFDLTLIFEWDSLDKAKQFFNPNVNTNLEKIMVSKLLNAKSEKSFTFFEKGSEASMETKLEDEVKKRLQQIDMKRSLEISQAIKNADGLCARITGLLKHLNSVTLPAQFTGASVSAQEYDRRLVLYAEKGTATRIKLSLEEKQIPYGVFLVDIEAGGADDLKNESARSLLPILKDGDVIVHELGAILEYLEITYPQNQMLYFADRSLRAKALTRFHEVQAFAIQTNEFCRFVASLTERSEAISVAQTGPAAKNFYDGLRTYEKYLTPITGAKDPDFVAGDKITLGDFGLYVCVAAANSLLQSLDIRAIEEKYPRVWKHYKRIAARPCVMKIIAE
mmetsp:Transcript_6891/g.11844  ORF Transcript_6891/g.11844 Transcript_6891/m.11844 type:complete len:388 (-) Transcript_6891:362-1525(-)|eukprot:CAMPEP_0196664876 /NCGR_PEP_ID=MMETSP1086-20130531/58774_1 /TAXON_ID=77921 /ORGANISM="Cyanoptyche  gloeocystis , Strain SAG4.97" /LENGTH=387 /DNA_ID=CAMNT_0042001369 /DNA_START=46 /DNA_END=1209 /DNA_ORIENTATION=-